MFILISNHNYWQWILCITADLLSPWVAFAIVWGLGSTCDYKSRYIFSDWLRKVQKDAQHKTPFPEDGLVFDYRYKYKIIQEISKLRNRAFFPKAFMPMYIASALFTWKLN